MRSASVCGVSSSRCCPDPRVNPGVARFGSDKAGLSNMASERWLRHCLELPDAFHDSLTRVQSTRVEIAGRSVVTVINDVRVFGLDASSVSTVPLCLQPTLLVRADRGDGAGAAHDDCLGLLRDERRRRAISGAPEGLLDRRRTGPGALDPRGGACAPPPAGSVTPARDGRTSQARPGCEICSNVNTLGRRLRNVYTDGVYQRISRTDHTPALRCLTRP